MCNSNNYEIITLPEGHTYYRWFSVSGEGTDAPFAKKIATVNIKSSYSAARIAYKIKNSVDRWEKNK